MALTVWRWFVAAAIGCAAIWVGFFTRGQRKPAAPTTRDQVSPQSMTYSATLGTIRQATDRLRLLTIRDSVLALANKQKTPGLTVLVSDAYGPAGPRIDSLLRSRFAQNVGSTNTRVIVAAVMDSAQFERGLPRPRPGWSLPIHVFTPQSASDSTCVAILRIPQPLSGAPSYVTRNIASRETVGSVLSTCSYYATFGAPGPDIARWLRDRSWRFASIADWKDRPQPLERRPIYEIPVYARIFGGFSGFDDNSWQVRSFLSTTGITCLAGRPGKCAEAALNGRAVTGDSTWRSSVVALSGTNQARFYFPREPLPLGPFDAWVLSEMVRTLGPDKFAQFWHSPEPVDRAFASAAGQSLDEWIGEWARRIYGPMKTGPHLPVAGFVTGIIFLVSGFGVSAAIANRRRVA